MLTDAQVRRIKPSEKKTKYSDEKGMYLEVTPSGGMHWRMKFRFNGKENIFSIGTYPDTTLAQARRMRDEARLQLKDGINRYKTTDDDGYISEWHSGGGCGQELEGGRAVRRHLGLVRSRRWRARLRSAHFWRLA